MNDKKIVLVTEDDKSLRNALDSKLNTSGFVILDAENGEEGLNLALLEHPDIILLDIAMPKMDGLTMLERLRQDEWGKDVPVIILTNLSSADENRNKTITKLEPTYYLTKSDIKIEQVVEKIKERLGLFLI